MERLLLYPNPNRMRVVLIFLGIFSGTALHAQMQPFTAFSNTDTSILNKKWSVSSYMGIVSGYGSIYTPIGLQLNRRLTNNVFAFAGISTAPAYYNFNHSFVTANSFKNSFPGSMYTRYEAGLMYVNDARTFSISGSISVNQSNYRFPKQPPPPLIRQ
jgi:hypothetical protein